MMQMPLLGIISAVMDPESKDRPFGEQTSLFEALSHACGFEGVPSYVLPLQTITNNQSLIGYRFHKGTWVQEQAPLPNVAYNRIPSRAYEQASEFREFKRLVHKSTKGRIFNRTGFFSKLQVHSLLKNQLPSALHLPHTEVASTPEQVLRQAAIWGELWLKPIEGSLGRHVFRILREPFGFTIESSDAASAEHFYTPEAVSHVATLLPQDNFLIQQGIQRSEHHLRPFDLRVLLHKDEHGKFSVTNLFARLAEHGQIVTNVSAGGDGFSIKDLFTIQEHRKLIALSLACAKQLDASIPGPLGELGLDLAIDRNRQFWLIEANSKPRLKMDPNDPVTPLIARRLVQYAKYLLTQPRKPSSPTNKATPQPSPSTSQKRARRDLKDR